MFSPRADARHFSPERGARYDHAIVIGGSIAGLIAARVLSDHFHRVTIVERDSVPGMPAHRKGVPHGRHAHLLLLGGQRILEGLFPGLDADLAAEGAVPFDWIDDIQWFNFAGAKMRFASDMRSHVCSREMLEWAIRRRVLALPSITVLNGREVVALRGDVGDRGVTGVLMRRDGDGSGAEDIAIEADMIVDASGRQSRAPQWLQDLGFTAPLETTIDARLGYASRVYRAPAGADAWKALYLQRTHAADTRGGLVLPLEGDHWMVTLVGVGGDYPPTNAEAFLEFARSLPHRQLFDAIKHAEPLTPVHGFRGANNRRRHFEKLVRQPERFVTIGDAFCAFNPVYGQGMTTAAVGALALDRSLRARPRSEAVDSLRGFADRFHKDLACVVDAPWSLSIAQDLRLPRTEGGQPGMLDGLIHRYVDAVTRLACVDATALLALTHVLHLLTPPSALFHPRILTRVLANMVVPRPVRLSIKQQLSGMVEPA
jgi:2-polyprenyl-6-methoxyphenol hydroxylase-like FAD-dependent oxidoreductase